MSDLTFNKIAGATLATALAVFGLKEVSGMVFEHHEMEKPGYAITVAEESAGGGAVADVPPDWGTVLPVADVKAGEAVFAKCTSCHNAANGGANGTGPNLWGVVGRKPGSHPGFAYSSGMTEFGAKQPIWDYEHIYEFVKSPSKYIPGTKMTFVGLKKPEDRINVIAYLHAQGSSLPIPAPNPAAAAAAAAPAPAGGTAPGAAEAGQPTSTPAAAPTAGPAASAPVAAGVDAAKTASPN